MHQGHVTLILPIYFSPVTKIYVYQHRCSGLVSKVISDEQRNITIPPVWSASRPADSCLGPERDQT